MGIADDLLMTPQRPPMSAAEDMLGELPAGVAPANYGDTAGPAESQLYLDERDVRADLIAEE